MTMVRPYRRDFNRSARAAGIGLAVLLLAVAWQATLVAQAPPVHFQHAGVMPPGAIGRLRLTQGGPLSGYYQPVQVHGPQGVQISFAAGEDFGPARPVPQLAAMLISPVYRLRVTNIPNQEGMEVFPTIELVDRLYPPPGEALRFPVPIELTQQELELALRGKFVTRVIYVEDPLRALPLPEKNNHQSWFEVKAGDNPLEVADRLGRPIAILRIGGRVPDASGPAPNFLFGSPPVQLFDGPEHHQKRPAQ